jgi:hypothetical protein
MKGVLVPTTAALQNLVVEYLQVSDGDLLTPLHKGLG